MAMSNKHEEDFKTFLHSDVVRYERPPVSPKIQILPLTELDWKTFEQLCCRLVERQPGVEGTPHLYGVPGDDQAGVDIVARRRVDGVLQTWCYQCKKHGYFSPGEFKKAIAALEYKADYYVFFLASQAQASLREIEMKNDRVELWDAEDISRRLKGYPDLVAEFFHSAWVEGFVVTPGQAVRDVREKPTSSVSIEDVKGDIRDSVIVGRDFVLQVVGQTGGQIPPARNLPAQLAALQGALPHLPHPAEKAAAQAAIEELEAAIAALPEREEAYLTQVRKRFEKQAGTYVEITSETREEKQAETADDFDLAEIAALMERIDDLAGLEELKQQGQELVRIRIGSLREALERYPCLTLLGDPGCGKTTALEHLAYQLADRPLREGDLVLPVRLSEFRGGLSPEEFLEKNWRLSEEAGYWGVPELATNLDGYLEAGRLVILFDALNEMPGEGFDERVETLHEFIDQWGQKRNRFLVTCRLLDYGRGLSGLQRVEVLPFSDQQIQEFLQRVLKKHWKAMWGALAQGSDEARRLLEMARNPYMLKIMVQVYVTERGKLPQNRAELMTRFTEIVFARAQRKTPSEEWLHADIQREALSVLAFKMQDRPDAGTVVERYELEADWPETIKPKRKAIPAPPLDRVLSLAAGANMIEMPVDRSTVRFYHQLLQEYFAARAMLNRGPGSLADKWRWDWLETDMPPVGQHGDFDPLPPPPPTGWEETTILAAGLAAENDDQLVRALIQVNPVLAGRCLHEGQAKVDKAVRGAVIRSLLLAIADAEVALRVRISAGEVLGYLGDPRLGEMVLVPTGEFVMGDDKSNYDDEEPQHQLYLPAYRLGKYPVTNAEYGRFVEAGGYQEKRWWTVSGWAEKEQPRYEEEPWKEPRYWQDSRFNLPNRPVVGVSWCECVAYCRWLSAESGLVYRLPSEAEWEKGARGTDGRRYPWEGEFEASRLNAMEGEQGVWATTPVGVYPSGESPFGALDCAGNVWEWCATKWGKAYPYDTAEDEWSEAYLEGDDVRVLRGGSWSSVQVFTRCADRGRRDPDSSRGRGDHGFRLVSPI
jgi:formylglycine-generating enzyme required for sulfatase activity